MPLKQERFKPLISNYLILDDYHEIHGNPSFRGVPYGNLCLRSPSFLYNKAFELMNSLALP
jgi:hypothetical protein